MSDSKKREAQQITDLMWALLQKRDDVRAMLVSRFLNDLESGFEDRRRLYEKARSEGLTYEEYEKEMMKGG